MLTLRRCFAGGEIDHAGRLISGLIFRYLESPHPHSDWETSVEIWLYLAIVAAVAAIALAALFAQQVNSASPGSDRMQELMGAIREGAMAFIRREYTAVAGFVAIMAILIFVLLDWGRPWGAVAYIFGAFLSAMAGFVGMRIATAANARTAEAAREGGIEKALPLAFRGGGVMGFTVAGLGLLGLSLGYLFFETILGDEQSFEIITPLG